MKLIHHHFFGISTLFLISTLSLVLCPYSKVEESFNLQASYDLYQNGVLPAVTRVFGRDDGSVTDAEYDHLQYPGVVPRTFLGPLLLSALSRCTMILLSPFYPSSESFTNSSFFSEALSIDGLHRFYLLLFVLHAQYRLATSLNNKWNIVTATSKHNSFRLGNYYLLITASQFHLPFYSSRLLPNTFALALVLHAYADWLFGRIARPLSLLVFTAAIVRCDVALLLFVVGGSLLLRRKVSVLTCLVIGVTTGVVALILTVPLDSVLWGRLLWPEGEVLWFNTVDNRSAEYGTSPWYWYFTSAVPKAMLVNLLLVPFGLLRSSKSNSSANSSAYGNGDGPLSYFLPVLVFVILYSILPHKEVRFIFVALPIFNCTAARGTEILHQWAQDLWHGTANDAIISAAAVALSKKTDDRTHAPPQKRTNSAWKRVAAVLLFLFGLGAITASACVSIVFLAVSRENYPGGRALALLTSVIKQRVANDRLEGTIHIHIDVASAMTGAMSKSSISRLMNICASESDGASGSGSGSGSGRNSLCRVKKGGYEEENSGDVATGVVGDDEDGGRYDYLLSEEKDVDGYRVLHVVGGRPRLDLKKMRIVAEDAIFVLERDGV